MSAPQYRLFSCLAPVKLYRLTKHSLGLLPTDKTLSKFVALENKNPPYIILLGPLQQMLFYYKFAEDKSLDSPQF
jgi:hypothetical protein